MTSVSDMSTTSNLVGSSELWTCLLCTALGARLERRRNKVAERMGYGSDALALKLRQEGKIMSKSLIVTVVKPSNVVEPRKKWPGQAKSC